MMFLSSSLTLLPKLPQDMEDFGELHPLLTLHIDVLYLWRITTLIAGFTSVVSSFIPVNIDELWHTTIKGLTSADPHPWHDWRRSARCITRQVQVTTFSYCLVLQRVDGWWHWGEKWKWKFKKKEDQPLFLLIDFIVGDIKIELQAQILKLYVLQTNAWTTFLRDTGIENANGIL